MCHGGAPAFVRLGRPVRLRVVSRGCCNCAGAAVGTPAPGPTRALGSPPAGRAVHHPRVMGVFHMCGTGAVGKLCCTERQVLRKTSEPRPDRVWCEATGSAGNTLTGPNRVDFDQDGSPRAGLITGSKVRDQASTAQATGKLSVSLAKRPGATQRKHRVAPSRWVNSPIRSELRRGPDENHPFLHLFGSEPCSGPQLKPGCVLKAVL